MTALVRHGYAERESMTENREGADGGDPFCAELTTVGELVDWLQTQPREWRIVMSKDAEGNGHSPMASALQAMYVLETTFSGEIYPTNDQVDDEDSGYDDEDRPPEDAEPVVLLIPTN